MILWRLILLQTDYFTDVWNMASLIAQKRTCYRENPDLETGEN